MGTQGTGRKRSTKKERATAEDEALNLIAREAEARLAAKRAARAEAREIRMKELERQQKEEDSEKYSRSSRIQTLTDDDDRVSVGSRGSFRSELDSVGAFGGGSSSSQKKSKKKKKHKHKDRDRNGFEDDYSVVSGRSSRISDESRGSRSSRMDLTAEEREFLEKGCRAPSSLTATTLTSLGGTSSRRGSGETALTVDADSSIREIKEIHELKDQIQDVETKYMQNLKEVKDSLVEVEEKYRKAMVSNAQLDNEKSNLMYEVDTLKDNLMELEELLSESRRQYEDKAKDYEREKHTHGVLQFHFNEMKESLKQSEELLNKHGIVLGPDLSINGDAGETEGDESADAAPRPALDSQGRSVEGNSILEIRLRKLVDEREKMIEQVKKLKAQLEQKTQKNSTDLSPDGEIVENGNDPNIMELQRDSSRQINDLKFKLVKAEQDVTALEQNVTRLEGHVTRYKSLAENAEKVEDELKAEKRKLQRELRSALDKIEELESSNSHLNKRLEKMKSSRGLAPTP
uniref:Leucine-rich repeat flightless-interacting protein 2-like n=1 Tax=Oryzias melastigma TaxID=30732 RepID=A0A3B3C1S1_ORYME